jgi:hypothetical protein
MSSVADRVREHRARKKSGVVLITIAADEAALASALVDAKLLDHNLADDQAAIAQATSRLIESFAMAKK